MKIGDATSQLLQVMLFRRHEDSDAHESMSGRCYWESMYGKHAGHWSWRFGRTLIDFLFYPWDGPDHCQKADERDYYRALHKVKTYEGRAR